MDRFCKDECPYKRTEDCALPAVAEEILNGGDRVIGYFVSSLAIVGNGLSGMGDMNSAQYAQRAALARVAARRERIGQCVSFHIGLVRLMEASG